MGSSRDAFSAGYQPAAMPIPPAKENATAIAALDTKVGQPSEFEINFEATTPPAIPRIPPKIASTTASVRKRNHPRLLKEAQATVLMLHFPPSSFRESQAARKITWMGACFAGYY
jgi:hypothetical protein